MRRMGICWAAISADRSRVSPGKVPGSRAVISVAVDVVDIGDLRGVQQRLAGLPKGELGLCRSPS